MDTCIPNYDKKNTCWIYCRKCEFVYRNKIYFHHHDHKLRSKGHYWCGDCNKHLKGLPSYVYHITQTKKHMRNKLKNKSIE